MRAIATMPMRLNLQRPERLYKIILATRGHDDAETDLIAAIAGVASWRDASLEVSNHRWTSCRHVWNVSYR